MGVIRSGCRHFVAVTLFASAVTVGLGAPVLSGDADLSGSIEITDAVSVVNVASSPEHGGLMGLDLLVIDANQDGLLDSGDAQRVAEILLGLVQPLFITGETTVATISFNYPPATAATESNALAQLSFHFRPPATATERDAVVRAPPSYDYPEP